MGVTRNSNRKIITASLLLFIFVFSSFTVQAQTDPPISITKIFNDEKNKATQPLLERGKAATQNVHLISENIEWIAESFENNQSEAYRASFELFEGVNYIATFTRKENTLEGGFILSGSLEDTTEGYITLVSTEGVVSAILTDADHLYQLQRNSEMQYQFVKIDQSSFPPESEPLIPETTTATLNAEKSDTPLAMDSGGQIDVMVVYSDDARAGAGGTANMINLINLAVAETNQGYQRSGITHRFRLVHHEEVSYNELNGGTSLDWVKTIDNLTFVDGVIDNVHTLRNTYAADLVVMIVEDYHSTCGIGWLMTSSTMTESHGFSVVSRNCATGYYSFAHETGHNMGAHHDRQNASGSGYFSYSYGYWAPNYSFRTIMAYNCPTSCSRINNWSNPQVTFNGIPTGVESTAPGSADNRLTLNNTAAQVANFRQSLAPPSAPINLIATETTMYSISIAFNDTSSDETGFKVERSINSQPWLQIAILPDNVSTYSDLNLACSQNYAYRVRATNLQGDSDYSNTLSTTTQACGPPAAPHPIQLSIATTAVIFTWQDVEGETAYLVEQLSGNPLVWSPLDTLPANSTSYYLQNLTMDTAYTVRFAAENSYGKTTGAPISFTTMSKAIFLPMITR